MKLMKTQVRKQVRDCLRAQAASLLSELDSESRRVLELAAEKGAYSWLTAKHYGFHLHKGAFRGALHLCYGWTPPNLPTTCACGKPFTVSHPAVFSSSGGQGKAATALYGHIASDKRREPFSVVMAYIHTKLSVALVKSAVASLRGCRHRIVTSDIDSSLSLAVSECKII